MLSGKAKSAGIYVLVIFAAVCMTLLAMPMADMPCKVTVTHKVARFVPASKNRLAGEIRTFDMTEDMVGIGRVTGSRVVCEVFYTGRS